MAMLLAMYQKMRLIREKNQATLDLTRFSSKYDRVSKNIERVQKMYTSKIASLESQANMMRTRAKTIFQQQSGLYMQASSAYLDPYSSYGAQNAFQSQRIQAYLQDGVPLAFVDENDLTKGIEKGKYSFNDATALMYIYQSGQLNSLTANKDKDLLDYKDANGDPKQISKKDAIMFQHAVTAAGQEYMQRTNLLNQSTSNYETNVSIWLEAAKAQLEAEQDAAVEPLAYQQTMWELEKEQTENKLTRIKEELQHYDQLLGDETKGHAPRFGLG